MLELPNFDALSTEQEDILDIPLGESAVVIGPPGTGKTVMAIYRAQAMQKQGLNTVLLMYNRLLSEYTQAAVSALDIGGSVSTYHRWFPRLWESLYGVEPPKLSTWVYDWHSCVEQLVRQPPAQRDLHIIVDEGQDMPKEFYLMLRNLGASLTVFADENQAITDQHSTIEEILMMTGVPEARHLRHNYRNTRPIAQLAAEFYTGLRSGIPDLPPASARGEKPSLQKYDKIFHELGAVTKYEKNYPQEIIGVLVPYANQVRSVLNRLKDKTQNPVQVYVSQAPGADPLPKIDFGTPGIKVVTYASAKGLEFHAVFLPELQSVKGDPSADDIRMKMYVLCSRAKRVLNLAYSGEGNPELVERLPLSLMEDRRS